MSWTDLIEKTINCVEWPDASGEDDHGRDGGSGKGFKQSSHVETKDKSAARTTYTSKTDNRQVEVEKQGENTFVRERNPKAGRQGYRNKFTGSHSEAVDHLKQNYGIDHKH